MESSPDRVSHPIVDRGRPQHRSLASGPGAADQLTHRVVVGDGRVLVHVEAGKAGHPLAVEEVVRLRKTQGHEGLHPFPGVRPVGPGDEFLKIGPVPGQVRLHRPQFSVLEPVALLSPLVVLQDRIIRSQGVQKRPVAEGLDGVVGPVDHSPARHVTKVPAAVQGVSGQDPAGLAVGLQELTLQEGPFGRIHGRIHHQELFLGQGHGAFQAQQEEGESDPCDPPCGPHPL